MTPSSENDPSDLFAPVEKKVRLFESVLDQLESLIDEGRLVPGDRLPSERALSETLQVSRPSLREALRVLDAMNIITVRTGVVGGSIISNDVGPAIGRFLRLYMALGHFSVKDLFDLRAMITASSVPIACEASSEEQAERLRALVADMGRATDARDKYMELDARFHLAVAMMAGNRLNAELVGAVRGALTHFFQAAPIDQAAWKKLVRPAQKEAKAIADAIQDRDAVTAGAALDRRSKLYDVYWTD